ncbi:MAG: 3'-5' exonuclease [Legionellales bacterium]|nr:3'-5' exonuclease [Legionellales bacterium]|tara:strand:- start:273 stop:1049 length:777 start_codon:yes stop_codon:yes gene_type:complete
MNILVFDIETVPDIESGKKLYNFEGLKAEDAAELMFSYRRQETDGSSDFLRHYMHKIVAISLVLRTNDKLSVWSLGDIDADEKEIIQRFFEGVERYTPTIVSWNGSGFDLPVLHYRSLLHGVVAQRYWENGEDDQSFKWNNYLSRFHSRHTDLMDVISGYSPVAKAPLDQIATLLGFPGKMGMSGGKVWDCYLKGGIEEIRNYCETDVLNTYLVYLRYELIRGHLTESAYERECEHVRDMLGDETRPHLKEFLETWQA